MLDLFKDCSPLIAAIYFSLYFSFFYYLYKVSSLFERVRSFVNSFLTKLIIKKGWRHRIGSLMSYLINCIFCLPFWISLLLVLTFDLPLSFSIFSAVISSILYSSLLQAMTFNSSGKKRL